MKKGVFKVFSFVTILTLMIMALPVQSAQAVSPDIVISQVYGGGGNSGATYTNDFIELFNRGTAAVDISGWSVQYASATGTSWQVTTLSGTVQPGQYYLVQEAAGSGGTTSLPTPDATGSIGMSATAGKVVVMNTTTALSGANPSSANIIDLVGFGTTANFYEGSGPAPAPSNSTSDSRAGNGCTDTDNNAADFTTAAPAPRNTASPLNPCGGGDTAPFVSSTTPTDGATNVAIDANINIALSEPVDVSGTWFDISCGTSDDHTATVSGGPTTFTLDPDTDFANDETCTVTVYAAQITDQDTNDPPDNMAADYVFSFNTASGTVAEALVVISQVYGGGGNSGATLKNDFIELYNRSASAVDITDWSVQYASSSGSSWSKTTLSGIMQPGQYYLIQEAAGSGGTVNLPLPDATGSIAMSATKGKVALVNNSTTLTGTCPTGVIDFVGYGDANCSETSPAPGLSNTTADLRKSDGAQDTNDNSADFIAGEPNPRNSFFPFAAVGLATPAAVVPGQATLLTVAVTPGTDPASTDIAVICDLSSIGGDAAQPFYDDHTNGDATAGDNIFSFSTTGPASGTPNITCTFADSEGRSGTTGISLNLIIVIPIGQVNGQVPESDSCTSHASPYVGQTVTIQGVIYEKTLQATSGSYTYKGFFIQNTAATADGDPTTSDGLFVYMGSYTSLIGGYEPVVGDEVAITGKVSEYYNFTELGSASLVTLVHTGVDIGSEVAPVVADPPISLTAANCYWERLQGMRVQVPTGSTVLGGRNVFSPADAEIWVASPDSTIAQREDPYTRRAFRDAHPLDDNYDPNNWDGNGYRILMGSLGIKATANNGAGDAQALIAPARTFDTVTNAPAGGLNYTYSKYRIEISEQPTFGEGVDPALNNPPTTFNRTEDYSIVDYNLENLYDYRDNPFSGCDFNGGDNTGCSNVGTPFIDPITPSYNYVPANEATYLARLNDIALQIINDLHSPDILMVQEVENQDICTVSGGALDCGTTDNADGKPDDLQELALKIAENGGPAYDAAFDRDSSDLRGIVPAFLYRSDRVQLLSPVGDPILGNSPAIPGYTAVPYDSDVSNPKTLNAVLPSGVSACETSWVFPRAPDIGLFRIWRVSIDFGSYQDVYVINNHFKSGPDSCVAHRTEQAKYNAAIVEFLQGEKPDARIVVGGDLNVYPRPDDPFAPIGQPGSSDQLGSLYDPGLGMTNLWSVLLDQAPEAAYSYVYVGMAQTLDQMFVNQPLLADLQQFRSAHINSDFPADYAGDVARGTSDHDPQVATCTLPVVTLDELVNLVQQYADDGQITGNNTEKTLLDHLDKAARFKAQGKDAAYRAQLLAFINQVQGKAPQFVTQEAADALSNVAALLRSLP